MTRSQVLLAVAAAALEAALLAWALGMVPRARGRAKDRVYPLLLAHVLGVLMFVAGGSAQATRQWLTAFSRAPAPPFHAFAAGFVTFTPELRGFGYLGARIGAEHVAVAQNALLAGTSYKAVVLHDLRLAVAWLAARPEVDAARIGVTGVSYGGEMSVALAATEPRVRAVVAEGFSGGTGPLRPRTATSFPNYHADHETLFANRDLWQEDLFLLIAPRPLLMVSGTTDYQPPDAALVRLLDGVYSRAGRRADFATAQMHGDHEYFAGPAIAFFRAHL